MFEENILKIIFFNLKELNKNTLDLEFKVFNLFFFLECSLNVPNILIQ